MLVFTQFLLRKKRWELCFLLLFFIALTSRGNTYYFNAASGDDSRTADQAQHIETPWRTINKLNAYLSSLRPGDSILFHRGNIFPGHLIITVSGLAGRPIVFSAYGKGTDPVICGFQKLSGWKSAGGGIWKSSIPDFGRRLNILTVSGISMPMGRTPNATDAHGAYFTIESHIGNKSISGDQIAKGPDWTGADVIIRKNRFNLDRNKIIAQSGNTIQYKGGSYYEPTNQFGYFIQNDVRTLDKPGEWYFDSSSNQLSFFNGVQNPSDLEIKAAVIDNLVQVKNQQWLVFKNLLLSGSNLDAVNILNSSQISFSGCTISFSGRNAINGVRVSNLTVEYSTINSCNNNAIDISGNHNLIQDNKISQAGVIPGMGEAEASYIGINMNGSDNSVQSNEIDSTGYVPIFFLGEKNSIKNNLIQYFAFVKDDGGGIYTWAGNIDSSVKRGAGYISGNTVLDGMTAPAGTDGKQAAIAYGIYLDENSSMLEVTGNTVGRCTGGIFLQDAHDILVSGNTVFNNGFQISLRHALQKGVLRNNIITENTAVIMANGQFGLVLSSAISDNITDFAVFKNNQYFQPVQWQNSFYKVSTRVPGSKVAQYMGNSDQWEKTYGKNSNSKYFILKGPVLFEFNKNKTTKTLPLKGAFTDPTGRTITTEIKINALSSVLLFQK